MLIIGTGCRVQVFSLILDSSVGLSAGIQSAEHVHALAETCLALVTMLSPNQFRITAVLAISFHLKISHFVNYLRRTLTLKMQLFKYFDW